MWEIMYSMHYIYVQKMASIQKGEGQRGRTKDNHFDREKSKRVEGGESLAGGFEEYLTYRLMFSTMELSKIKITDGKPGERILAFIEEDKQRNLRKHFIKY